MWVYIGIACGAVLLLVILLIAAYNRRIRLEKKVEEAFSTMDIYLVKRWELIPKLVDTVKAYSAYEKQTLEQVVKLRSADYDRLSAEEKLSANAKLSRNLDRVMVVAEGYPELKSSENYLELSRELVKVEDEIAQSRKYYNGCVRLFNTKVETFPGNVLSGIFGFKSKPMYEAEERQRSDINVRM